MADKYRQKWSREETILAFDLYCRTPFSKIGHTNPDIIELANMIGRTPGSVGLKMANLAACDPEVLGRNLHGMSNGSKLDKEVFEEFAMDWEGLSLLAQEIKAQYKGIDISLINPELEIEELPLGEYREQQTKVRIGQYFFRTAVLNAYGGKCCVTGLNDATLLRASHIKPWSVSDEKTERTNPSNGLCLNSFHDAAFDRGLITIDKNMMIIMSKELLNTNMDSETRNWMMSYAGKQIMLPDKFYPGKDFIEYHNDMIFRGA